MVWGWGPPGLVEELHVYSRSCCWASCSAAFSRASTAAVPPPPCSVTAQTAPRRCCATTASATNGDRTSYRAPSFAPTTSGRFARTPSRPLRSSATSPPRPARAPSHGWDTRQYAAPQVLQAPWPRRAAALPALRAVAGLSAAPGVRASKLAPGHREGRGARPGDPALQDCFVEPPAAAGVRPSACSRTATTPANRKLVLLSSGAETIPEISPTRP